MMSQRVGTGLNVVLVAIAGFFTLSSLVAIFAIAYNVGQDPNATLWRIALFALIAIAVLVVPATAVASILHSRKAPLRAVVRWTSVCVLGVSFVSLCMLTLASAV